MFERRRPAAFTNPFWAFLCDVEMLILMATAQLDREVERVKNDPAADVGPARRMGRRLGQTAMVAFVAAYLALELAGLTSFRVPF